MTPFEDFIYFFMSQIVYRGKFVFELIIACGLFAFCLPKRKKFVLRLIGSLLVIFALSACWSPMREYPFVLNFLKYFSLFVFVLLGIGFCFRTSIWTLLFCGTGGYVLQHLSYRVGMLAVYAIPSENVKTWLLCEALNLLIYIGLYLAAYFIFIRKTKMNDEICSKNKNIILVSLAAVICVIVLSIGFDSYSSGLSTVIYIICLLYIIVACLLLFFMLLSIFNNNRLRNEAETLERMMRIKEEQYIVSQNTIDIINVKCHDMKHQLSMLKGKLNTDDISELERTISIYDMAVKTGNQALDVVIAEKSLICQQYNIKFSCMADGEKLGFISDSDIYALFANAIDNAITATSKLDDEGKRVITITVKNSLGLVAIHIDNYFADKLQFDDGLPVTTKADKNYHGYGLKSIKMTVEKYGGFMAVNTEDDIFKLNISIPFVK